LPDVAVAAVDVNVVAAAAAVVDMRLRAGACQQFLTISTLSFQYLLLSTVSLDLKISQFFSKIHFSFKMSQSVGNIGMMSLNGFEP